jgi:hypothetical protein
MQMLGDCQYNVINGEESKPIDHHMINKFNQDPLRGVGSAIMGGAGRPIRSVNARVTAAHSPEGGKKTYPYHIKLTTNEIIPYEVAMADLARGGKKRDYHSKPLDSSGRMIDSSGDKQMYFEPSL